MKYLQPNWPAPSHIKAYTTLREGWGAYAKNNLNGSFQTAYRPENEQLKALLQLPSEPIWVKQKHSAIALPATLENKEQIADATYTSESNRICAVLTADCLPILICDRQGTEVAAIHAGWRGLLHGIIDATLAALSIEAKDLIAWLGPAIGPQKFEVGKDVFYAFIQKNPQTKTAFIPFGEEKWLANLYDLAKINLQKHGIFHIYGGEFCTFSAPDLFFSYRRDQGKTGRMASLIWIEEN